MASKQLLKENQLLPLGTIKKRKGGRKCGAGKAFRKKKVGGRKKWVCVTVKKGRRRSRRRR